MVRWFQNLLFFHVTDVVVTDGAIYFISYYSFSVEVFDEETWEHLYTLYDWSDSVLRYLKIRREFIYCVKSHKTSLAQHESISSDIRT